MTMIAADNNEQQASASLNGSIEHQNKQLTSDQVNSEIIEEKPFQKDFTVGEDLHMLLRYWYLIKNCAFKYFCVKISL